MQALCGGFDSLRLHNCRVMLRVGKQAFNLLERVRIPYTALCPSDGMAYILVSNTRFWEFDSPLGYMGG